MLYTLSVPLSAGASKSVVAAKVNTPASVNAKSAASTPARVVLKVGVDPSLQKIRSTPQVPSRTHCLLDSSNPLRSSVLLALSCSILYNFLVVQCVVST